MLLDVGAGKLRWWVVFGLSGADRVGGGSVVGPVSAVVEFEGDRVFGDVDGELMVSVGASGSDFLSNDHDDTPVGRAALHGGWFGRGAGWGSGRASARSLWAWSQLSGLGRVRSSSPVSGSKNIRVVGSMRMLTRVPARISAASRPPSHQPKGTATACIGKSSVGHAVAEPLMCWLRSPTKSGVIV
jgi:hypothetical protein